MLLFGPLSLSFDEAAVLQLRENLINTPRLNWLLHALLNLGQDCQIIFGQVPNLESASIHKQLLDVLESIGTGRSLNLPERLPNAVLIPLVVAHHLVQYVTLLEQRELTHADNVTGAFRGTVGLCTGLLGAFAVAGAPNQADLEKYGAAAVRLGLLAGLAVDLGETNNGQSKSLSVGWSSAEGHEALVRVLKTVPGAYVSVGYDENRATITAPASAVSKLVAQLKALDLTASGISLYGRFHSTLNSEILTELLDFCERHAEYQFSDAKDVVIPVHVEDEIGNRVTKGALHTHALRSILVTSPVWHRTLSNVLTGEDDGTMFLSLGRERCVPPSLLRKLGARHIHLADSSPIVHLSTASQTYAERPWRDNDIAVVGMACKLPGANDLTEFWDLLASAKPQHQEIGRDHPRFDFSDSPYRSVDDPGMRRKWFANLISGADQFDHKFFSKSPRESASMDPAQRLLLQVAYQAVEQSGYLNKNYNGTNNNVGVYLGTTGNEYQANAASQAANAFTTTGNLQGFLAGKLSHYFGWTGPAMVVDTACSGSLVAIHQACNALVSGECSAALAGGAHVLTQPVWFQNLAAGQFLSPTGQCKPFDAAADGYCRGEGVGAVFLKRMDRAAADGDSILGVIAATAVQQNQNCTPIFVPNVPSLGDLFRTVTTKAGVKPSQVSVVEAHGTGTLVGDPAEYSSIKTVLGGPNRTHEAPLVLGSVKGLVGHLEGTSGVVAMIKLLLMLHVGLVPPQASFKAMNPTIGATSDDNMAVATKLQAWDADFRVALINNYGASGSNASMVLAQAPALQLINATVMPDGVKYPFWLSAHDNEGLRRRAKILNDYIGRHRGRHSLANLSYNVAYQQNRALNTRAMINAASVSELSQKLAVLEKGEAQPLNDHKVVLCFGGQVSTFVGLDRQIYESTALFKKHVDAVNTIAQSLGVGSIFPAIFQRTPIQDTVLLQVALFALQYACARSWLDSGITPVAIIGHSFGELTSLCVSQSLSLGDTVKMITNRATLVRDTWGSDKGAMTAVSEASLEDVQRILVKVNTQHDDSPASIACYNGPRSFTIAGSTTAIDILTKDLTASPAAGIKSKRLDVSNAFHCALVDSLVDELEKSAQGLVFHEPVIPIERATEKAAKAGKITAKFVADHMRNPVYFDHALQRLAAKYATSSLVFLEAGSNSTITHMASRALAKANLKSAHFQGVSITKCDDGWNKLTDATLGLWRVGLKVHHWAHHPLQSRASSDISSLLLPAYQFDPESRHWITLKVPPKYAPALPGSSDNHPSAGAKETEEDGLVIFTGYQDGNAEQVARFRINTLSPKFEQLLSGHMTLQTAPICPATVQIGFVVEGLSGIRPVLTQDGCTPQFHDIQYHSPVCANSNVTTWIEATAEGAPGAAETGKWRFEVFSTDAKVAVNKTTKNLHTTGHVHFMPGNDASLQRELAYFPRLFGHDRATDLLSRSDVDEVLAKRNIYRIFSEIVDYGDEYQGLRKLVSKGNEAAGVVIPVTMKQTHEATNNVKFDPHLSDAFCQVAGVWANFFSARSPSDSYLANGIGQWIRAPAKETAPTEIHVFATTHRSSDKTFLSDVFVFDAADGSLLEVLLGIAYVQIPKAAMSRLLRRMSDERWLASSAPTQTVHTSGIPTIKAIPVPQQSLPSVSLPPREEVGAASPAPKAGIDIFGRVQSIIADLSGLEPDEIKKDSELADLGIDSLVGMELINELESAFELKLPENEIQVVVDIPGLMKCLLATLGADAYVSDDEDSDLSTSSNTQGNTGQTTPAPAESVKADEPDMDLSFETVMDAFNGAKALTDERIAEVGQTRYIQDALPLQTDLTVALTIEAFEARGAGIRDAQPGQRLIRIAHGAEHQHLVTYLYRMLETQTQVIKIDGEDIITRTAVPMPQLSSRAIFADLAARFPDQQTADKLTYYAGSNLARVLSGETDGVKLIFGSAQGRELAAGLYGDWPLNRATYAGLEDFLTRLANRLGSNGSGIDTENPLRILEMGAGTGGTTKRLVPLLAKLGLPVVYTFTDLSPSLVAQARKRWSKDYPFMRFAAHDIEKTPAPELAGTQHFVVASNAVHATHSLQESTRCIHRMLRPDGFLCLVEMTRPMFWVDIVFGLFEGWWMYDDGREHVIAHEKRWEADLHASGYGHVDWIDGESEESKIWKLIIAAANPESRCGRAKDTPVSNIVSPYVPNVSSECAEREEVIARYVTELSSGWDQPLKVTDQLNHPKQSESHGICVLITGGTGGLGSHLVAKALVRPGVSRVICLNRRNNRQEARQRQLQSLTEKGTGIAIRDVEDRIEVIESDLSKPSLGLSEEVYANLVNTVTHIVHNAWLMHSKWPVKRFEPQLRIMINMINLARDISMRKGPERPVTFEFISSIATVGHHPLWTGRPVVPEDRVPIQSVLPTGYGEAKYICERLLDATLHQYPDRFRAAAVRLGQIAGSSLTGYWNRTEHISFLIKSSQTLGALPDFAGSLGWTCVDNMAGTLVDILLQSDAVQLHPIYHIENPVRQPWRQMIATLADILRVSVVPFDEWVRRVREWPIKADNGAEGANPAYLLTDFLDDNFARMSCGGLLMGTAKAREHSPTLASVGPVSEATTRLFVDKWREMGFLNATD